MKNSVIVLFGFLLIFSIFFIFVFSVPDLFGKITGFDIISNLNLNEDSLENGCYIEFITEDKPKKTLVTTSNDDCTSLTLASKYAVKLDFVRLVELLMNQNNYDTGEAPSISSSLLEVIWYENSLTYSLVTDEEDVGCQSINFFGMNLYCFNKVTGEMPGETYLNSNLPKPNNIPKVIRIFTFFKIASQDGTQGIEGRTPLYKWDDRNTKESILTNPFEHSSRMIDSWNDGYTSTGTSDMCNDEPGRNVDMRRAHPETDEEQFYVFICPEFGDSSEEDARISYAGIMYHEALHRFGGPHCYSVYANDPNACIRSSICTGSSEGELFGGEKGTLRDKGFDSAYGSHVDFLGKMSQNEVLTCSERSIAFDEAKGEFEWKLCPGLDFPYEEPECVFYEAENENREDNEYQTIPFSEKESNEDDTSPDPGIENIEDSIENYLDPLTDNVESNILQEENTEQTVESEENELLDSSLVVPATVKKEIICNGCLEDDICYTYGYRKSLEYCSPPKHFISQLEEENTCENNFECKSNLCLDSKCVSGGLIQKIFSWFKNLFG